MELPSVTLTEASSSSNHGITPKSILKRSSSLDDDTSYRRNNNIRCGSDYEEGISGGRTTTLQKRTASFEDGFDDEFDSSDDGGGDDYEQPIEIIREESMSVHYRQGRRDYNFLLDASESMTYSRRLAIYLMKYNWYYPKNKTADGDDNEKSVDLDDLFSMDTASVMSFSVHKSTAFRKASLGKAWAYFDHVTLPRYVCNEEDERTAAHRMSQLSCFSRQGNCLGRAWKQLSHRHHVPLRRADPGEMHKYTKLYSPLWTPMAQLGDFGVGTGLYFTTLRALTVMTFVLGLLNIPNILYFRSDSYSGGQSGVSFFLKGSAICTRTKWVPCPDCRISDQWEDNMDRLANRTITDDEGVTKVLIYALRNQCDGARFQLARINFVTIVFLVIGLIVLGAYQKSWEKKFTEGKEKAHDYSIVIKNPPMSASDPDEWKHYFETTFRARVALVTIGLNNDLFVRTLVERREVLRRLELALDPGISLDVLSLAKISSKIEHDRNGLQILLRLFIPGIPELFARLTVLTARVQGLAQQSYEVRHVFVTFEKVSTRIRILNEFSLGNLAIHGWLKSATRGKQHLLFQDTLLKVRQPEEPATIRWQDLNAKLSTRVLELIFTNVMGLAGIAFFAYLITVIFEFNYLFGAAFIALSNLGYAEFAKLITKLFESHFSEGDVQASIYVKVALFRFVNTAIIITIITPFTSHLEADGLVPVVCAVFLAELITVNMARFADPIGHFKRHFLAPRARTQDAMNVNMRGTPVELAERVTDSTKMIFLTFWYSAVFPAGFFFCSLVLFVKYYTDQFGLMRTWKRVLPVGNRIANFGRRYFISTAVVAFATISSYAWSGFPYDNLCENVGEKVDTSYDGTFILQTGESGERVEATVSEGDPTFRYCLQDLILVSGPSFPAIPENQPLGGEWMTEDQENITTIFGWASVACIAFVGITIVWAWSDVIAELFYQKTEATESVNFKRTFHEVMDQSSMSTYIPEVKSSLFPYPLVACNTDGIDDEIYTWTDADHPHSYYDITKDATYLTDGIGFDVNHAFSSLTHYHPDETILAARDSDDGSSEFLRSPIVSMNHRQGGSLSSGELNEYEAFLKGSARSRRGLMESLSEGGEQNDDAIQPKKSKDIPHYKRRSWSTNTGTPGAPGADEYDEGASLNPLPNLRKTLSKRPPSISLSARKLLGQEEL